MVSGALASKRCVHTRCLHTLFTCVSSPRTNQSCDWWTSWSQPAAGCGRPDPPVLRRPRRSGAFHWHGGQLPGPEAGGLGCCRCQPLLFTSGRWGAAGCHGDLHRGERPVKCVCGNGTTVLISRDSRVAPSPHPCVLSLRSVVMTTWSSWRSFTWCPASCRITPDSASWSSTAWRLLSGRSLTSHLSEPACSAALPSSWSPWQPAATSPWC